MAFATYLFTHNSQIAIFAFALGFAFAVPTILLILYNGLMLGAFFAVFAAKGLAFNLAGWLMIHGTTELFAIAIAGARRACGSARRSPSPAGCRASNRRSAPAGWPRRRWPAR